MSCCNHEHVRECGPVECPQKFMRFGVCSELVSKGGQGGNDHYDSWRNCTICGGLGKADDMCACGCTAYEERCGTIYSSHKDDTKICPNCEGKGGGEWALNPTDMDMSGNLSFWEYCEVCGGEGKVLND